VSYQSQKPAANNKRLSLKGETFEQTIARIRERNLKAAAEQAAKDAKWRAQMLEEEKAQQKPAQNPTITPVNIEQPQSIIEQNRAKNRLFERSENILDLMVPKEKQAQTLANPSISDTKIEAENTPPQRPAIDPLEEKIAAIRARNLKLAAEKAAEQAKKEQEIESGKVQTKIQEQPLTASQKWQQAKLAQIEAQLAEQKQRSQENENDGFER